MDQTTLFTSAPLLPPQPVEGSSPEARAGLDRSDADAVARTLYRQRRLSSDELGAQWLDEGTPVGAAWAFAWLQQHFALDEQHNWVPPEEFFFGNVYQRAAALEAAAATLEASEAEAGRGELWEASLWRAQAERFRKLVAWESLDDVAVTPRDAFVPVEVLQRFVNEVLAEGPEYRVERQNHVLYVVGPSSRTIGDFRAYLNHATEVEAVERKGRSKEAIAIDRAAAVDRARALEARFEDQFRIWLNASPYRDDVERAYNETFNAYVAPKLEGRAVESEVPAWTGAYTLHPWQREAIEQMLLAGGGVVGLDVGLGKTLVGVTLTALQRARGSARRPMVVVPKSLVAKWRDTFREALDDASVLIIGMTWRRGAWMDDDRRAITRKLQLLTRRGFTAVLITREAFEFIPFRHDNLKGLLQRDPELQRLGELQRLKRAFRGQKRYLRSQTESERLATVAMRYEDAASSMRRLAGQAIYWEDLEVDYLVVDEAHAYKNLTSPMMVFGQNVKFAGVSDGSVRALDFFLKGEALRNRTGGRGVVLLTASIVKNSPLEIFTLMKLALGPEALPGARTVKEFVRRYMAIEPAVVLDSAGDVASSPAVMGFTALDELRGIMHRFVYRRTAREVGMKLPTVETVEHLFGMEPDVRQEYQRLSERLVSLARRRGRAKGGSRTRKARDSEFFKVYARMRKLTLEPGLYSDAFATRSNPRFVLTAKIAKDAIDRGGRVLAFMDMAKSRDDDGELLATNAFERLEHQLAGAGLDMRRVRFATADTLPNAQSRRALERDFAAGLVDLVVGNTALIGEGVDFQAGTTDVIHCDVPWDPGTYWQRLGRAVRQGNEQPTVRSHLVLAKGSFDSLTTATMLGKKSWTEHLLEGAERTTPNSSVLDPREEMLAALAEDKDQALREIREVKQRIFDGAAKARVKKALLDLRRVALWATSILEARSRLERNRGHALFAEHMEARIAMLQKSYDQALHAAVRDPDLPESYRRVLREREPFLIDADGRFFTPGGVFVAPAPLLTGKETVRTEVRVKPEATQKGGRRKRRKAASGEDGETRIEYRKDARRWACFIEAVDLHRHTIRFHPLLPLPGARDGYEIPLSELVNTSGHSPELDAEAVTDEMVASITFEEHARLDPDLVEVMAERLQKRFRNLKPQRAFVVTADGWVEERNLRQRPLQADERFLLNSTSDRALFEEQFAGDPFPYA